MAIQNIDNYIEALPKERRDWLDRFNGYVSPEPNSGCWLWTGRLFSNGYGQFAIGSQNARGAHRVAFEAFKGPIPSGLHLDHLCRVRSCVNPAHLEPVTPKVNVLRGVGISAVNAAKTHCKRGHALSGENLLLHHGNRECRECYRVASREGKARRKLAA